MKGGVFEYLDYKAYLEDWMGARAPGGRGERSRMAQALRCHVAYLSRVLAGQAHLSLEQAHALNPYLGHSPEEADFFLLLVGSARAGTAELRRHFEAKVRAELERRRLLKNRPEYRKALSEVDQATYFSAWYYAAIHLLLAVPELRTREALSRYLRVSPRRVGEALRFLVASGLAIERKGRYETGPASIHLDNDSPMVSRHHANWRMQALQSLERESPDELHYSSAVTLSRADVPEARKILVSAIEKVRALAEASKEEALYCYALDLFEVGGKAE
jgi:uncharacterized protein (TIGR02147 family)